MNALKQLDWRKISVAFAAANAVVVALVGAAAAQVHREERERNTFRWTDKNRWE